MRFALWGLVLAAALFIISGGHILFLPPASRPRRGNGVRALTVQTVELG